MDSLSGSSGACAFHALKELRVVEIEANSIRHRLTSVDGGL